MTVHPQPWVELDGTRIYCKGDRLDAGVTILDGLSIDWGQEHPMAERGTTTAQFRLWDADGYWIRRAAQDYVTISSPSPVLGVPVVIGWTVGSATRVIFRGSVSNADIAMSRRKVSDHTSRRGWTIAVTATERPTDLGSAPVSDETWPAESAIARANRLKAAIAAAGVDISQVYFEPDTVTWPMGLLDVQDKNVLELLTAFYLSFGLTWDYRADENVTRQVPVDQYMRPQFLYRVPGTNDHVIAAAPTTLAGFGDDSATYVSTILRGCELTVEDETMSIDRADRINHIVLNYVKADGTKWGTVGTWQGVTRTRSMSTDTWLNLDPPNNANGSRTFNNWWSRIRTTNLPAHPPVTFDAVDGFLSIEQAFTLTRCSQSWASVTILSDPYAAAIDRLAQVQAIGGTVTYHAEKWTVRLVPSWCGAFSWSGGVQHPWDKMRDGNSVWAALTWNAPTARLDRSMTWADIRNVALTPDVQPNPAQEIP